MQRNPYWPLKGPSFFVFLGAETPSLCFLFSRCARDDVGFGSNFAARMASRRNFANMLDPKLVVRLEASFGRTSFDLVGVGTSQDLDVSRTTSPVTVIIKLAPGRSAYRAGFVS